MSRSGATLRRDPAEAHSAQRGASRIGPAPHAYPWYVRLIWLCFWVFAIYYVLRYLFPDLQSEILNPP